ncbi:hypothetical protein BSBH6_02732 [Bacillus subtilis]|nr:hypothetical protein BSBH6_02732 [Bacillus subtilis]RPK23698.1 hypothetical protein BH5_02729 [Bacillus subtilis]
MSILQRKIRVSWKSPYETEVVKVLQREAITVEEMNTNRNYINVRNGMLSLTTFTLHPHSPEFLSTVQIPIEYNPNATAPHFMSFMKDITIDDSQLINVHQELVGYWLTVETKAEKAVYYYGGGANGKSVMASIVTALVGEDNVSSVPLSEFSQTFGMENLIGKSLNFAAENEMGGSRTKQSDFYNMYSQWLTVQGIDDKGTKSRQVFWRYFKVILDSENISIVKKKVKGTVYYDGTTA